MTRFYVRSLTSNDFEALRQLEADISGATGDNVSCPHYVRLCTEFYGDTCFMALVDGRPAGYLLCFVREREAYCTTLAARTEFQRTRVTPLLVAAFLRAAIDKVDVCWFTVKPDNAGVRALYAMLGATEVGMLQDAEGPGDERIVSKIDRPRFETLRGTYQRLGLISSQASA